MDHTIFTEYWFYSGVVFCIILGVLIGMRVKFRDEKPLARKEDLKRLQRKFEVLLAQYNDWQSAGDAITHTGEDVRLQKHQEAYSLWLSLLWGLKENNGLASSVEKCQKWWNENCLYLSDMARTGLQEALALSSNFPMTLGSSEDQKEYYKKVYDAGKNIIVAANLTPLKDEEIRKA